MQKGFQEKYNKKLLDTFKVLIKILNEGDYYWFAWAGTCLGAIRHKGIIPWDDDIDIAMPRKEYNRFLKEYVNNENYYVISMDNDSEYPFTFAKFCDAHSTILETNGINTTFGIYVDIFPIDNIDEKYENILSLKSEYHTIVRKYERSCNTYYTRHIWNMIINFRILNCKVIAEDLFFYRKRKKLFLDRIKSIDNKCCTNPTPYCVSFSGLYKEKEIFKSKWFDELISIPFEDFYVKIPKEYDVILKHMYGDYMQLPPVERRVSKHSHAYDNLSTWLSAKEARRRITQGIVAEF